MEHRCTWQLNTRECGQPAVYLGPGSFAMCQFHKQMRERWSLSTDLLLAAIAVRQVAYFWKHTPEFLNSPLTTDDPRKGEALQSTENQTEQPIYRGPYILMGHRDGMLYLTPARQDEHGHWVPLTPDEIREQSR